MVMGAGVLVPMDNSDGRGKRGIATRFSLDSIGGSILPWQGSMKDQPSSFSVGSGHQHHTWLSSSCKLCLSYTIRSTLSHLRRGQGAWRASAIRCVTSLVVYSTAPWLFQWERWLGWLQSTSHIQWSRGSYIKVLSEHCINIIPRWEAINEPCKNMENVHFKERVERQCQKDYSEVRRRIILNTATEISKNSVADSRE